MTSPGGRQLSVTGARWTDTGVSSGAAEASALMGGGDSSSGRPGRAARTATRLGRGSTSSRQAGIAAETESQRGSAGGAGDGGGTTPAPAARTRRASAAGAISVDVVPPAAASAADDVDVIVVEQVPEDAQPSTSPPVENTGDASSAAGALAGEEAPKTPRTPNLTVVTHTIAGRVGDSSAAGVLAEDSPTTAAKKKAKKPVKKKKERATRNVDHESAERINELYAASISLARFQRIMFASAWILVVVILWAVLSWFILVQGLIFTRQLQPGAQDQYVRKWAIGIGIDSVVQCKDALQSVVNSLILFLFTGTVFGPSKWLGMWLDTGSVQATLARAGAGMTFGAKFRAFLHFQRRTAGW